MKAIICTKYGPPEVLQVEEREIPKPKVNEVLVKIYATTVSVADVRVRSFKVPASIWLPARLFLGLKRPRKSILGMELSGEVVEIGKGVTKFKKGDKVFAATLQNFGAYADYTCISEDGPIALKPINITYEEAAAVPIGARTAYNYLKLGDVKTNQKILIYGASGSVGTYAVQLAKYFGAEVTGVCSSANVSLVKSLGAYKVIDYQTPNFTQHFETYDTIFITIDKCPFKACIKALKPKGTYLNIGRPIKSFEMLWTSITSNIKIVVGKNSPETSQVLYVLKNIIEKGQLKPVIDRQYKLNEIVEAHRYVDKGHKKGNIVITMNDKKSG